MIKSILLKIIKPIKTIFITHKHRKDSEKMMAAYLKIKAGKFCAISNKEAVA